MLSELQTNLKEYLFKRKWVEVDSGLGVILFKKERFFKPTKRKKSYSLEDLAEMSKTFFSNKRSYIYHKPLHISSEASKTLFVGAGVQLFNSSRNIEKLVGDIYISQPVIRTQYLGKASENEGISTSFVNLCTLKKKATFEDFIQYFENWLDFLSYIGIYASLLTIHLKSKITNWGQGEFENLSAHISYDKIEIGDVSYCIKMPIEHERQNICDAGFGLERIAFALNGCYYKNIFPTELEINENILDIIRTVTIMVGSGIVSGNKSSSYRLKKML